MDKTDTQSTKIEQTSVETPTTEQPTSKKNKKIVIASCITILLLLIALPILSHFELWYFKSIYSVTKEIANFLYLISGFLLVIGIYFTFQQVGLLKTQVTEQISSTEQQLNFIKIDMSNRNDRAAVEKSIDYLYLFSQQIFPNINNYYKSVRPQAIQIDGWDPSESDYKLNLFELPVPLQREIFEELDKRREHDLLDILNSIEYFSAGIIHGLGKEKVVYDPIATAFIKFISLEIIEISSQRHLGNPYENTIQLFKIWKSRKDHDQKALQIEEYESKLRESRAELEVAATRSKPLSHIGEFKD